MNPNNGKYYENDKDSLADQFPYAASFNGSRNRGGDGRRVDLSSQLADTTRDSASQPTSSNLPEGQNHILDIPNFLQYPHDLGKNRRHHHFICFNIYQGESDTTKVENRLTNQALSAVTNTGRFDFPGDIDKWNQTVRNLTLLGFSQEQISSVQKSIVLTADGYAVEGAAVNERLNVFEKFVQGKYGNILQGNRPGVQADQTANELNILDSFSELGKDVAGDVTSYLSSLTGNVYDDKTGELNKIDYERRGVTGRKVNRPKWEQNLLLANRRFGYANVKSKDTICLYMPLKIQMNDQLIYGEEDMGMLRNILSAAAMQRGSMSAVMERISTPLISGVVNQITGNLSVENVNIQAARNAGTRSVVNPRRESMFRDVGLRNHSFTFEFAAKNEREAQTVLNIIRMFRYHAYPALRGGGGHFFKFPSEFEATFYTILDSGAAVVNDNLPKMPRLALSGVATDYSGAGDFKTFKDGKPAFITMTLEFQEMEQLNNEHIVHGY